MLNFWTCTIARPKIVQYYHFCGCIFLAFCKCLIWSSTTIIHTWTIHTFLKFLKHLTIRKFLTSQLFGIQLFVACTLTPINMHIHLIKTNLIAKLCWRFHAQGSWLKVHVVVIMVFHKCKSFTTSYLFTIIVCYI
jgi:hypothetical protein